MWKIKIQLHGGGGGGSTTQIKNSAPGSTAAATIDNATSEQRQNLRDKMATAKGRKYTDKTNGTIDADTLNNLKKSLLGE